MRFYRRRSTTESVASSTDRRYMGLQSKTRRPHLRAGGKGGVVPGGGVGGAARRAQRHLPARAASAGCCRAACSRLVVVAVVAPMRMRASCWVVLLAGAALVGALALQVVLPGIACCGRCAYDRKQARGQHVTPCPAALQAPCECPSMCSREPARTCSRPVQNAAERHAHADDSPTCPVTEEQCHLTSRTDSAAERK